VISGASDGRGGGSSLNRLVRVKVTSAASGGGKYNGRIWPLPTTAIAATGNLAATELGTDPGSDNALILNNQEVGKSTHDLTTATVVVQFFNGIIIGATSDGITVVEIDGIDWENCS
jgi:hypothetical protein